MTTPPDSLVAAIRETPCIYIDATRIARANAMQQLAKSQSAATLALIDSEECAQEAAVALLKDRVGQLLWKQANDETCQAAAHDVTVLFAALRAFLTESVDKQAKENDA